jgi:Flp pilus assembly protein TadD
VASACVYLDYELYERAATVLRRAAEKNPDDPTPHALLPDVYEKLDLRTEADNARQRSDQIEERQRAAWRDAL